MRDTLPQGGIVLGGDNGQPARRLEWEEAIGEEEARNLLWAPYPGQSRYLLFAPSFYHRVTLPIALCSDIGPMFLPASGGGVSDVPKPTALCLKADIAGMVQYH